MKGLFLFQRRFAVIGHAIASDLKKTYGLSEFCGYVYLRSSYDWLKKQTDISYKNLLLDEDIHRRFKDEPIDKTFLAKLELEYGIPNLWPYLTVDRVMMYNQLVREYPYDTPPYTHEELMRILQVKAKAVIELFDKEKPDYVFMSVVGALGSMLIYQIAKKRGIPVINTIVARLGNLLVLSENYYDNSWADSRFDELQQGKTSSPKESEAKTRLDAFRANPTPYYADITPKKQAVSRRKQLGFLSPKNFTRSSAWWGKMLLTYLNNPFKNDYSEITPWHYTIDHIKRKLRAVRGFADLYDAPTQGEKFAFFPLHFEPEIALLLYAPFFIDQIYVIKQVARSLPIDFKLYVKDHPVMIGYRTREYYEELKKIPNVKLIDPSMPGFALTREAKLITTITGTVGWEGLLLGKPVITFGDVFYNKLSMTKCCRTIAELPYLVKSQLENFHYNEREMKNYIAALLEDGVDVPLMTLWEKEIDNVEKIKTELQPLADLLARKLVAK